MFFFVVKIYDLSVHSLYEVKKKSTSFFYNNLGIDAVIINFCFVLIDLINDYKIFILVMFVCDGFLWELLVCDGFHENCLYNGFSYELLVCDGFFKIIFSMKRCYVYVWGTCKNVWVLWLFFSMKRDHESIFRLISILF